MKGGVGGYTVLQKSVEWETGVEGEEYYFCRFLTITKGKVEGGVGGYIVLQRSVEWETNAEGKQTKRFHFCRFFTITKLGKLFQ